VTEPGSQFLGVLAAVVVLAAASGVLYEHLHRLKARLPSLLRADRARAQATLNYYLHVHDSSD
jgi:hypothetical protein